MTVSNLDGLRARDELLQVAAAWPALRARLVPVAAMDVMAHTAPKSRPALVVHISDLMRQIEDRVRFYGQVLLAETDDWTPSTSLMPGLLIDVAARYGHWTSKDDRAALDFLDDAEEMWRLVRAAIEGYAAPKWAGPCPEKCGGQIYQRADQLDAECRECGRLVGASEWREQMAEAFDSRLMSASELVSALVVTGHRVPEETVRTWIRRGRLPKIVESPDLFRFADAHELAEARSGRRTA